MEQKAPHQEFQAFCYTTNLNMIQKLGTVPQTQAGATVNLAQLDDTKTCYITQPFSYNYALVNQMQLQNGVQNAISNISFKCDVCGLMFAHLALLTAHKRMHNQDGDAGNITVVTQAQGQTLVQAAGGLVPAEAAAGLVQGQIQIVTAEPDHTQQQVAQISEVSGKTVLVDKTQKCISCAGPIVINPKRKGPKLIRCEQCISQDNLNHQQQQQQQRPMSQIYVAADGNVKFEMTEVPVTTDGQGHDSSAQMAMASGGKMAKQQQQDQACFGDAAARMFPAPGHHPVKKRNLASVTKCHKCNGSGIIFLGGNKNKMHLSTVDKPFHCNICGGTFSRYSSLWSHKKLHSGEKNFKCDICGLAFAKAVYLKNHSRIHTGEKPYRCATCGMQFSQSPHLKNHERTHSGEKPYVCEVCDKGFARHATLWNHRRIHTGEKPYKCDVCSSTFSQAAHLKSHTKVHSGEKPFKCDICTAAFADRFALKRHRNIHDKYGQTAPLQHSLNSSGGDTSGSGGGTDEGDAHGLQQGM